MATRILLCVFVPLRRRILPENFQTGQALRFFCLAVRAGKRAVRGGRLMRGVAADLRAAWAVPASGRRPRPGVAGGGAFVLAEGSELLAGGAVCVARVDQNGAGLVIAALQVIAADRDVRT